MKQQEELHAILRADLRMFLERTFVTLNPGTKYEHSWHIDAICHALTRCKMGLCKRLIITVPPRSTKSLCASIAYPAWLMGHDPSQRIIGVSYASPLSTDLANNMRNVMESNWYKKVFPDTQISKTKNTETFMKTTQEGSRFSTSIGGTLTGKGGNTIIIDDPIKASEEPSESTLNEVIDFYRGSLVTRLDDKINGVIIVIMQRMHENDLVGYLLESGGWEHLNLPAIAEEEQHIATGPDSYHTRKPGDILHPKREPIEVLDMMKAELGPYSFAAQYQQNPVPIGGGMIKWDWFKQYEVHPKPIDTDFIVQSWDTASSIKESSSYSVCTTWLCHGNNFYLLHVLRERLEYSSLLAIVKSQAQEWSSDLIIIEKTVGSMPLIDTLKKSTALNILTNTPKGDKDTRMMSEAPPIAAGKIYLPLEAPWLAEFRREIVHFPKSKYNDQIDSLSQFLLWTRRLGSQYPRGGGVPGVGSNDSGGSLTCIVTPIYSEPPDITFGDSF